MAYLQLSYNSSRCKWTALPNNLLQGHGCPQCNNNSRGENRITVFLDKYRINYVPQKKFDNCKDKYALPFDFYLPDYNTCIEYDGIQHFQLVEHFGGQEEFERRKINDNIKTNYCIDKNINLIRLPYTLSHEEVKNIILNIWNP